MNDNKFDFLVFIGRFQPYHLGHQTIVRTGLERADKLILLIGSAHRPRDTRNPFSFHEREQMIRQTLSDADNKRVIVSPLMDATYNDELWTATVQKCVAGIVASYSTQPQRPTKIGLIGYAKDKSSYYLRLFPQWAAVDVASKFSHSATDIRAGLFSEDVPRWQSIERWVPAAVFAWLKGFAESSDWAALKAEFDFVQRYRGGWDNAPYAPTFVTVDAVVIQSGHILLVERGANPGKGLYALPGGFVGQAETLKEACLRELKEETRLKIPPAVLAGHIVESAVFDDPHRSARGRTISHAFLIQLSPATVLPKVRGGDDAKKAFWLPLSRVNPEQMFEDHFFIIQRFIGQFS